MARRSGECHAEDLHRLASCGLSSVLAVEITAGRPPIPIELRRLIRERALSNISWGEERIANELLLKLGIRIWLTLSWVDYTMNMACLRRLHEFLPITMAFNALICGCLDTFIGQQTLSKTV